MRSPTRIMAATVLCFEALVVFFAGLVAKDLSDLSAGAALGLAGGTAALCVLAAGLLRSRAGYVLGSVLQVLLVLSGIWVPTMWFLGGMFAALWFGVLVAGSRLERQAQGDQAALPTESSSGPG